MWMIILATLAVAFASGLAMGSSLERGHWESAIKDQLNKLDALLARYARRVRARHAGRLPARRPGGVRIGANRRAGFDTADHQPPAPTSYANFGG